MLVFIKVVGFVSPFITKGLICPLGVVMFGYEGVSDIHLRLKVPTCGQRIVVLTISQYLE